MRYPIGLQTFDQLREGGYVYVDKTEDVYSLAHGSKIYFLGRPRRFGKSLLISTLKNYFLGRKELFKGLAIEKLETEWKTYPVLHIDFSCGSYFYKDGLDNVLDDYLSGWETQYHIEQTKRDYGIRFKRILEAIHTQTGVRAVVLIDEYDKPILETMDLDVQVDVAGQKVSLEDYNRNVLRSFFGTFKAADEHTHFVMLTGVTKFSQVSVFSDFNQPDDISMSPLYDTICGITTQEMLHYFPDAIHEMAQVYHCTDEEMVAKLKKQYDGYHFSDTMRGVFNPYSLLNAFKNHRMQDYWFRTGTPSYLIRLLNHFHEGIDELTGKYYFPEQFIDYRADVEKPLPMIFQSGYLTIKEFKPRTSAFLLDFPNDEVKRGFITLLTNNYLKPQENVDAWMMKAVDSLEDGHVDLFKEQLTAFLASIPYNMRRKDTEHEKERYFHYTFYLLLRLMSTYVVYTEKVQSQGRVDCIIETPKFIYIFEFKLDGSASEALQQIERMGYAREYATDDRTLYKIGVNFSSETGTVEDWKTVNLNSGMAVSEMDDII